MLLFHVFTLFIFAVFLYVVSSAKEVVFIGVSQLVGLLAGLWKTAQSISQHSVTQAAEETVRFWW